LEMNPIKKIGVAIAAAALLLSPMKVYSCGPFFDETIFTYQYHPDLPLKFYASGKLGVLLPAFARSFLVSAYRELSEKPLTANEQSAIIGLWESRMTNENGYSDGSAVQTWLAARNKIAGFKKIEQISTDRAPITASSDDVYNTYLNCPDDAFKNATATLQQKVTKYGAASDPVKSWVTAQDLVFCHCSGPAYLYDAKKFDPEPPFPGAAPANADAATKAERAYQIAAAHFYAQQFDLAAQEFDAIAKDDSSPYHSSAAYLAARCMLRKGTIAKKYDLAALQNAQTRMSAIANDPKSTADLRHSANQLLSFIAIRYSPDATLKELSRKLVSPGSEGDFRQELTDYTVMLDKLIGSNPDDFTSAPVKVAAIPNDARTDLTEWIIHVQSSEPSAAATSLQKWKENKSTLWLIPAIMHAKPGQQGVSELIDAALKVPATSPAFFTAHYYALCLLVEAKDNVKARAALNEVLVIKNIPPSTLNLFLDQKSLLSTSLSDFLADAVRTSSGASSYSDGLEMPDDFSKIEKRNSFYVGDPAFSPNAANVLNQSVPLNALSSASWQSWPTPMKRDYLQALWTRAVLLNDEKVLSQTSPLLAAQNPFLTKLLNEFKTVTNPDQKRFLSTYILVMNPAMRPYITPGTLRQAVFKDIDQYHDNWWCASPSPSREQDMTPQKVAKPKVTFLNPAQLAQAASEDKRLTAMGGGPTYLLTELIAYSKLPGAKDKRLAEAFYHAIRSPKFGCVDKTTTSLSKTAFTIMHKQFPHDPWTAKTQFWY
jgi:hypothetical protein